MRNEPVVEQRAQPADGLASKAFTLAVASAKLSRKPSTSYSSRRMARLHSLQDTTSSLQGELERKRRNRPARRTLSHQLRYSLVRTDDEEEFALVLPFVGIVASM